MGSQSSGRGRVEAPDGEETADGRRVMDSLRRVVRSLRISGRAAEGAVGLSGAQLFVLQKLAEGGPCSLNELAARTSTHQSSVSVVASRLVEKGLVARAKAAEDGRRLALSITPAGRAVLRKSPGVAQDRLLAGLERMGAQDRAQLALLLERWVEAAGLGDEAIGMFFETDGERRGQRGGEQVEG